MILIIDNYDSFVYNLARYVIEFGFCVKVERNNKISIDDIIKLKPSHIIISPGPCSPKEAGISNDVIRSFGHIIPILGVCLGHQCIGQFFGGEIVQSPYPFHGKNIEVNHNGEGIFKNLPASLSVTRYHSLVINTKGFPQDLTITAKTNDDIIMGVSHKLYPIYGVQFHPEAHLTQGGREIVENFLRIN